VRDENESVQVALTYDELIDGEAVEEYDALYVCTPNAYHKEYVEAAADHDKAVLCESPWRRPSSAPRNSSPPPRTSR